MAWFWSWVLVLGAVTMVGGVLASRMHRGPGAPRTPASVPRLLGGIVLAAIALAFCLPGRAPFAAGLGLGHGLLLGTAAAVLAVVALRAARPSDEYASRLACAAAAGGAAVLWVGVTQILFRGDPEYALLGGLAGGLLTLLPMAWDREEVEIKVFGASLLIAGLGSVLGLARYGLAAERPFWPLPTMPLAAGLLGVVLGGLLFGRQRSARWATAVIVLILEAGACFGARALLYRQEILNMPPQFSLLLFLGWLAFLLIAASSRLTDRLQFARVAPALLAVIALVIAFTIAGGYGAALMLAAGLPLALALWREGGGGAAFWALALGVLYLAYRLYLAQFEESFRGGQTLEFGRHYAFLGLATGLLWITGIRSARRSTGGLVAQCAALALLPAVLFVVFGYEGLLGLVLGLWIGQLMLPTWTVGEWDWAGLPSILLPLATVWALIIPNWAELMLDQPRWIRGAIVGLAAAVVLVVLGLMRQRSPSPPAQAAPAAEG